MGSNYKRTILKESIVQSLQGWHQKAHQKSKLGKVHESSVGDSAIDSLNGGSRSTHTKWSWNMFKHRQRMSLGNNLCPF
ncbi:hypothetical protein O6H91_01G158500 [Diphasiastrum complanatum]|uniref:Uncharacterized protein n=1 Tax=Diphasiastrum complanatum TaxID=34168 RepID=A0ACC2EXX6_DIPCM|nr:hypothetical protein O6H91_01G158500 [Diphasiastrum complanatum]